MGPAHGLSQALHHLIHGQRTATLGTLDADGEVSLSRVPYAVDLQGSSLIIHISALAAHTVHLQRHPRASLLIAEREVDGASVHALPRVSIDVQAKTCTDKVHQRHAQACYLERFPEAESMMQLGDFRFVRLLPLGARQVAGFGAARSLDASAIAQILCMVA
ncbi:pyridoxamine 5'-phosphate oxidase family protein [Hydrogenophaga sp. PAMC20947]|uniref:HugZ family pyridoxamine 5'-phosphate oxidase n=1 Tax=Hydrogenophaga sp. PAMC20947 TaxID=2565558 RepID=UPI00109E2863|nr:pyridoxamine 5'-phosphate oxidase family protein [Hydrogenophaga sp. PAMC20947]QCB46012.1 pyridoxamine 5'-phosphate oxidase [Hydrogenophaga sp. PAMC20947]